jgi:hypothetical protein
LRIVEQVSAELATRDPAHLDPELLVRLRRCRKRVAAGDAGTIGQPDVLPGNEIEWTRGRQTQNHLDHVLRELLNTADLAGRPQRFYVRRFRCEGQLQMEIGMGDCVAQENIRGAPERTEGLGGFDFSFQQLGGTIAAIAPFASERDGQTLFEGLIQDWRLFGRVEG